MNTEKYFPQIFTDEDVVQTDGNINCSDYEFNTIWIDFLRECTQIYTYIFY